MTNNELHTTPHTCHIGEWAGLTETFEIRTYKLDEEFIIEAHGADTLVRHTRCTRNEPAGSLVGQWIGQAIEEMGW